MASKILKSVGSIATMGVLGSSLFGKKKEAAPSPASSGPIVMPIADDAKVAAARKRSIATQRQRGGRSSTILTNDSESLGG